MSARDNGNPLFMLAAVVGVPLVLIGAAVLVGMWAF